MPDKEAAAAAKALAGFSIQDKESGKALDTFMDRPLPAMIPRP